MVLSVMRIFDALNDPITGFVIDNVHTRWGKFKPSILVGGVASVIFYLALFGNIGSGVGFVILFALAYLFWDISYGINDIAYWTLLPALSTDQKQRERNGAFARICASLGMYIIMVGWEPITRVLGNTPRAWFWVAVVLSVIFLAFLCFPLFGVKEPRLVSEKQPRKKRPCARWCARWSRTISSCGRRSPWDCLWSATAPRQASPSIIWNISSATRACMRSSRRSAAWLSSSR